MIKNYIHQLPHIFLLIILFCGCNVPVSKKVGETKDARPSKQIAFMERLKTIKESYYDFYGNAVKFDSVANDLKNFALDSLKDIKEWEFIVKKIDDNFYSSGPLSRELFQGQDIYNLNLISILDVNSLFKGDQEILNFVNFKATVLKTPKSENLIKQMEVIKTLSIGDTVLIDGSVTKINNHLKVDFSDIVEPVFVNPIDLLITNIVKK